MAYSRRTIKTGFTLPGPQDVVKMCRKTLRRRRKRNEIAQLLTKPDWVLNDMGISRMDVREASAFRGDPSLHLKALAARRRFWSRQR